MTDRVVTWEAGAAPLGRAVVTIGVFDGVHLGHQMIVRAAAADAASRGVPCVAVTFDRDPDQVVTPESAVAQLLTEADKCTFLLEARADHVLVVPFDVALATMSPEAFVKHVLLAATDPLAVHVGVDFRFGRFAEGDVATLSQAGATYGFEVVAHELVRHKGAAITSTRIRQTVAAGQVAEAAELLGRPHRATGIVVKGRGEGASRLNIPTANLLPVEHAALPADGVYAGVTHADDTTWPSAISVGVPPTFPKAHHPMEAHLIGFRGELYGRTLVIDFHQLIRPQHAFSSPEDLAEAMRADIERVRSMHSTVHPVE